MSGVGGGSGAYLDPQRLVRRNADDDLIVVDVVEEDVGGLVELDAHLRLALVQGLAALLSPQRNTA